MSLNNLFLFCCFFSSFTKLQKLFESRNKSIRYIADCYVRKITTMICQFVSQDACFYRIMCVFMRRQFTLQGKGCARLRTYKISGKILFGQSTTVRFLSEPLAAWSCLFVKSSEQPQPLQRKCLTPLFSDYRINRSFTTFFLSSAFSLVFISYLWKGQSKKLYLIVCQNRIREFQFYGNDLATMQIHWYAVLCYI